MDEVAIVGLGSWGLCVTERIVHRARQIDSRVRLHVIEPGQLGGGVYTKEQPDYLILNNPCSQLSLYASPDADEDPPYAVGLFEWARRTGYTWVGYECRITDEGRAIEPTDYLPRRLMGEYLNWFYDTLVADAPSNLEIVRHYASATDITAEIGGRERVWLDNGSTISVDHVVLTSGHTYNDERVGDSGDVHYLRPYPVDFFDETVPAGEPVAIAGMGLVGYDLLTALTVGRGGAFVDEGDRKRYQSSGREPDIYLYSRSGVPYCAKAVHGVDPYGDYRAIVCTPEAFAELTNPAGSLTRQRVDFRADLLPLLYQEMQARYYTHAAYLEGGSANEAEVREQLEKGHADGEFELAVQSFEPRFGVFDPSSHVFADANASYPTSDAYQAHVYEMVATDLDQALYVGGSPVKAAQEITRILRDQMRAVIEFGGLTLESYIDFQSRVRGRINRLEAGPPSHRSQELLALLDAGLVHEPFGPDPEVIATKDGRVHLRSTRLDEPFEKTVNVVIRGHLDLPSLARSTSPLLNRLYAKGRLTQLQYGDTAVGSVAISEDFHPYDAEGRLQVNLTLLGVLTEGVRYFTHYLPSPRSRLRAVLDAQQCVEHIIG